MKAALQITLLKWNWKLVLLNNMNSNNSNFAEVKLWMITQLGLLALPALIIYYKSYKGVSCNLTDGTDVFIRICFASFLLCFGTIHSVLIGKWAKRAIKNFWFEWENGKKSAVFWAQNCQNQLFIWPKIGKISCFRAKNG